MINEGKQIALKLACLAPLLTLLLADVYVSAIGATGLSVGLACGLTLSENAWSLKFSWKSKRRLFVALLVIICALPLSVPYVPIAIGSPSLILYFALSTSASVLFVDTAEHYEKEDCRPTKPKGRPSISVAELCSAFPAALFAAYLKLALTAAQRAYLESSLLATLVWASWGPSLMFLASLALSKMFRADFSRSALDIAALACPLILSYGILLLGLGPFGHAQLLRFGSKSPEPSALYFALALSSMGTTLIGYKQWSERTTSAQLIGLSLSADGLSRREAEVVAAALAGDSMQKTAARLGVSIGAIAEYRRRALKKAGADSMLQLVSKSREPANAAKDKRGSKTLLVLFSEYVVIISPLLTAYGAYVDRLAQGRGWAVEAIWLCCFALAIHVATRLSAKTQSEAQNPTAGANAFVLIGFMLTNGALNLLYGYRLVGTGALCLCTVAMLVITIVSGLFHCGDAAGIGVLLGASPLAGLTVDCPIAIGTLGLLLIALGLIISIREKATLDSTPILSIEEQLHGQGLTPAQTKVAVLLASGMRAADVAAELSISKATVATHRKVIYKRLGIHSQHELIVLVGSMAISRNPL